MPLISSLDILLPRILVVVEGLSPLLEVEFFAVGFRFLHRLIHPCSWVGLIGKWWRWLSKFGFFIHIVLCVKILFVL